MRDPYAFGFYSACLALVVLVTAALLSARSGQAYAVLDSASAVIEALAASGIAGIAFAAYGAWKRDVRQHKTLTVIWEASVAFREIEIGFNEWFFGPATEQLYEPDPGRLNAQLATSPLGQALRAFKKQCILLDKVVLKESWRWVNHATELDVLARALTAEFFGTMAKGKVRPGIVDFLYPHEGQTRRKTQAEWEALMDTIERELAELEERFG
ncbi:hypothetical protein RRX38_21550 [Pseudomonas sp. DTU_2021_1001937_2_SI_NGA_ILE_001]|uniref:hypothetical protein n=1 Tax=Pseudomonas sp. DTU_2021_1001937_2_SI_NGA_ILE_001 TaxID=3077589 RepID=UPI0028FC0DEB|nr:hypothetical protein [Pseudomonas sp. DTU_2021_1001937_2_SI_NGA_ILE_001]WNW13634.1 hypothetical protein RRX38_21550 [Pseudomonas sp. DTU_2021_1001937_2_SI_NGA_ILE_001]